MKLEDFDYTLPEELIAQTPLDKRDSCRLMVLDKKRNTIEHHYFCDVINYLNPGDCLVLNDSRVIPARLFGIKEGTGARIELLLIRRIEGDKWECLLKPAKRLHEGDTVVFAGSADLSDVESRVSVRSNTDLDGGERAFKAHILGIYDEANATRLVEFEYEGKFMERKKATGRITRLYTAA